MAHELRIVEWRSCVRTDLYCAGSGLLGKWGSARLRRGKRSSCLRCKASRAQACTIGAGVLDEATVGASQHRLHFCYMVTCAQTFAPEVMMCPRFFH